MIHQNKINFYVQNVEELQVCGTSILHFKGGRYIKPFPITKIKTKHSLESCTGCSKHYRVLVEEINQLYQKFPNCCKNHQNLLKHPEFKKTDFINTPEWCADKIMSSFHVILEFIDEENWYDEIVAYIEYCIFSFGDFPSGYGIPFQLDNYFNCLIHLLSHKPTDIELLTEKISNTEIEKRLNTIINYLKGYINNSQKDNKRDINLLISTYDKWFKTFPFDISYFKHLKERFSNHLPLFEEEPKRNKYIGVHIAKVASKKSLLRVLENVTRKIIAEVNGLTLHEEDKLTKAENIELELILNKRKLELNEIANHSNHDRQSYIRVLKKWYKSELDFIKMIKPYLTKAQFKGNNERPNRTDIAYELYYLKETYSLELTNPFPSDKAWNEVSELYQKNSKNIQIAYNKISNNREVRINAKGINNIEYVIQNRLINKPKALALAEDELKLAKLKS